jgi:hypothetical protein
MHIKDSATTAAATIPMLIVDGTTRAAIAAGTEVRFSFFNAAYTKTFTTGTVAAQRENYFTAPTYAGTGGTATFTNAATVTISNAPQAGSLSAFTNTPSALWIEAGQSRFDGNVLINSALTMADTINMVLNTTTGTKIGTATNQKLGFWNATPIIQPASANQAAITDSTTGTAGFTLVDVGIANINNNFASLNRQVDAFRTALVNAGIIKGAA